MSIGHGQSLTLRLSKLPNLTRSRRSCYEPPERMIRMDDRSYYKTMSVQLYDESQPITLDAELRAFVTGASQWEFLLWNKDKGEKVLECGYGELVTLILLGKAQQDALKTEARKAEATEAIKAVQG